MLTSNNITSNKFRTTLSSSLGLSRRSTLMRLSRSARTTKRVRTSIPTFDHRLTIQQRKRLMCMKRRWTPHRHLLHLSLLHHHLRHRSYITPLLHLQFTHSHHRPLPLLQSMLRLRRPLSMLHRSALPRPITTMSTRSMLRLSDQTQSTAQQRPSYPMAVC